jgi:hypothetical protein
LRNTIPLQSLPLRCQICKQHLAQAPWLPLPLSLGLGLGLGQELRLRLLELLELGLGLGLGPASEILSLLVVNATRYHREMTRYRVASAQILVLNQTVT